MYGIPENNDAVFIENNPTIPTIKPINTIIPKNGSIIKLANISIVGSPKKLNQTTDVGIKLTLMADDKISAISCLNTLRKIFETGLEKTASDNTAEKEY